MPADNFMWFPDSAKGGLLDGKSAKPEGESTDAWFAKKKALEVKNFTFSLEHSDSTSSGTSGSASGRVKFNEFAFSKSVDLSSVPLYQACAAGAHYPTVMLAIRKAGGSNLIYLQYMFRQVFVVSIGWSGGGGDELPSEDVKFRFGAFGIRYVQQLADGTEGTKMEAAWSVVENKNSLSVAGLSSPPPYLLNTQA
jgi:type VI secretion system secreted protein Hcp